MPRNLLIGTLLSAFLAAGAESNLHAHVGGHAAAAGTNLHAWTSPRTGEPVPGSLLFVSGDAVHVEDAVGRVHVWPISALEPADRQLVERFRTRTARLNGADQPGPRTTAGETVTPPLVWFAMMGTLAGLLMCRAGASSTVMLRGAVASLAIAVPLACSGSGASPVTPSSPTAPTPTPTPTPTPSTGGGATLASYFASFPAHVRTRQDSQNLYVESDGLADHSMMIGIRSWQQQVPLPQAYTGSNAFTIPLVPRLAAQPVSARTALFNGAIALAVNGVPIFNALNNRGDDAFLFGELDDFGGHAGRADDYHYHTAPLFLEPTVGSNRPIAVALDGFLLYGSAEPDGSAVRPLDDYNGHTDAATVYHYHGTRTYPYINGGMKGVVSVVNDHVDPQPSLVPVRPAGTPLNGATVTRHAATGSNAWTLEYLLNGRTYKVDYRIEGTRYTFVFTDPAGATRTETYTR